jgi:ribosomal protein S18 acetylase RimI-like enzyme
MSTYLVRLAHPTELAQLQMIEQAAAIRFLETPYVDLTSGAPSVDDVYLRQQETQGLVWVAVAQEEGTEQPVGFVVAEALDGTLYIHELDVLPAHGQRGLGRRLVEAVYERARADGYPAVTLSTFRDVAWNAPFYARLGFRELAEAELTPGLQAIRAAEAQGGLAISERVIMQLSLQAQ